MAVLRQQLFLGNERIDVSFLRSIESGVAGDFDALAGTIMAGQKPQITSGFNIITTGITKATQLQLRVASSSVIHYLATDSGSIFTVPAGVANEVLTSTNNNVSGGFQVSSVNYVGLDLIRSVDDSTSDVAAFIDSSTLSELFKEVPLARTLNYRIVISTLDFNSTPSVAPIARVTTDSANGIILVEDARNIFWRLGSGGTVPNAKNVYSWPTGRNEATYNDKFLGGDKSITSLKSYIDASLTRLWEIGGGEYWYSPTSDKNVKFVTQGGVFGNGEWFEWISSNLHWKGLVFLFDNSTGYKNEVADQTSNLTGLTDLADGDCIYVDVDRTQNRTGGAALVAVKTPLVSLGSPTVPGARYIIAWRNGTDVFTRLNPRPVGAGTFTPATTVANGAVSISGTPTAPSTPFATVYDTANQYSLSGGLTRGGFSSGFVGGTGEIVIGGNFHDQNIRLNGAVSTDYNTIVSSYSSTSTGGALQVQNLTATADYAVIMNLSSLAKVGSLLNMYFGLESNGAIGMGPVPHIVAAPTPTGNNFVAAKMYLKVAGTTPHARTQLVILDVDNLETIIWEGLPH